MTDQDVVNLIGELKRLGRETQWVEFKVGNADPKEIGEYISALANGAASVGRPFGYLVWGIEDKSLRTVGTSFDPFSMKVSGQELESWLVHQLSPRVGFRFVTSTVDGCNVVVLEIPRADSSPVQFIGVDYIRIGSYKKPLRGYPQIERELWRSFDRVPFELQIERENVPADEVLSLLDWGLYFDALKLPRPSEPLKALDSLANEGLIVPNLRGGWDITHLGAVTLARTLKGFHRVWRKTLRIVRYSGTGRTETIDEREIMPGYMRGLDDAMAYLEIVLPHREVIDVLRRTVYDYPVIAVRELIANALIHQDLSITGAGPMVEIFDGRIEITNPGAPLVDTHRFIDVAPKSRNEGMASLLRRAGLCEERGTGIDKAVVAIEESILPPPEFRALAENTRVFVYGPRTFNQMSRRERLEAVYLHASVRYVSGQTITNSSVRQRFGLTDSSRTSRLIAEAIKADLVKVRDSEVPRRFVEYLPHWA